MNDALLSLWSSNDPIDLQAPSSIDLVCAIQEVLDHLGGPAIRHLGASDIVGDYKTRKEEHWSTVLAGPEALLVLKFLEELESVASGLESSLCLRQLGCLL